MKKYGLLVLALGLSLVSYNAFSADDNTTPAAAPAATDTTAAAPATPVAEQAPATVADAPAGVPAGAPGAPATPTDNLEFISGEISAADATAKSVTVKLYGETENAASEKMLTVSVDDTTDITDGEKDRDLKSLTPGTEVDVEYDPATKKATYIFVY
jgi:hypothetical protein